MKLSPRTIVYWLAIGVSLGCGKKVVEAGSSAPPPAADAKEVSFSANVLSIVEAKCLPCHSAGQKNGGLILETVEQAGHSGGDASVRWKLAVARIEEGSMPPRGYPRMSSAELEWVKAWLDGGLKP